MVAAASLHKGSNKVRHIFRDFAPFAPRDLAKCEIQNEIESRARLSHHGKTNGHQNVFVDFDFGEAKQVPSTQYGGHNCFAVK